MIPHCGYRRIIRLYIYIFNRYFSRVRTSEDISMTDFGRESRDPPPARWTLHWKPGSYVLSTEHLVAWKKSYAKEAVHFHGEPRVTVPNTGFRFSVYSLHVHSCMLSPSSPASCKSRCLLLLTVVLCSVFVLLSFDSSKDGGVFITINARHLLPLLRLVGHYIHAWVIHQL